MSGEPGIDSDDLDTVTEAPDPTLVAPSSSGFIDTDGVKILYAIDTTPGKFHKNMINLGLGTSWGSSPFLSVDADGNGNKTTKGGITFYRFKARKGSLPSGDENRTVRLDWRSSTGGTECGVSGAKSRGYIGRANDTKNCEITVIFKTSGGLVAGNRSHFHGSLKARGSGHIDSNECTLQVGGRHPYIQRSRHAELYEVEYTHPLYEYQNVTFVSPFTQSNIPLIIHNRWFGMKLVLWNINNNQAVHAEMWIDDHPINDAGGFSNNWKRCWVFEHAGSKSPTWSGPNCEFRVNMANNVDVVAYNIHEIAPSTTTPILMSAQELAEKAEYEDVHGTTAPIWINQISEVALIKDPNTVIPEDQIEAAQEVDELVLSESTTSATIGDTTMTEGSEVDQSLEVTSPHFVAITDANTGIEISAPKKLIAIKKLTVNKEPKPLVSIVDEADENYILPDAKDSQNPIIEEDYQLTDNFRDDHFGPEFV